MTARMAAAWPLSRGRRKSGLARLLGRAGLFAAALALAGCGGINLGGFGDSSGGPATLETQIDQIKAGGDGAKVALLLPLSGRGELGEIARGLKDASELALFDSANPTITLIPKDTGGTAGGAEKAAREAVAEGAELIIGPLLAGSVQAVAPVAQSANVPVIAFSSDRTVASRGVFLLSFLPQQEVSRVVAYAASRGKKRFATLLPATPYGTLVEQAMVSSVPRRGGTIVANEKFQRAAGGLDAPVNNIAAAVRDPGRNVQAIMIAEGGELLKNIGARLQSAGVDPRSVQLLGTGLWDDHDLGAAPGLTGGWYAGPPPNAKAAFARRFKSAYGRQPPGIASLAYDAVSLAVALGKGAPGQRFSVATLTNAEGFAGVDGLFRFTPDGLNQRGLAVMEVTPSGPRVVSQPPQRFTAAF